MHSIKSREGKISAMGCGQRLLRRQLLRGTGGGLPGAAGWTETGLLISNFSLIPSQAAERSWPRGGRPWPCVREERKADRHPSKGQDNAGFLFPSMRTLRGTTSAMPGKLVSLQPGLWAAPSQPDVAATSGRSHPLPCPADHWNYWGG